MIRLPREPDQGLSDEKVLSELSKIRSLLRELVEQRVAGNTGWQPEGRGTNPTGPDSGRSEHPRDQPTTLTTTTTPQPNDTCFWTRDPDRQTPTLQILPALWGGRLALVSFIPKG